MQSTFIFLDITKVPNFWCQDAIVSKNQGVCHVLYMLFGVTFRVKQVLMLGPISFKVICKTLS